MWMVVAEYKALNAKNAEMINSMWLMRNSYEAFYSLPDSTAVLCMDHETTESTTSRTV